MLKRAWPAGLAAVLVVAAATARAQGSDTPPDEVAKVFAKVGARAADVSRDQAECKTLAAITHVLPSYVNWGPPQGGLVGAAIEAGARSGANFEAKARHLAICMRHRGYAQLTLTPAEARAYNAIPDATARDAWMDKFLARDEMATRIERALTPVTPPLPTADEHELFAIRAARLDPKSLALAAGLVSAGDDAVTGKVSRRRTAVLKDDYSFRTGVFSHKILSGTVFQEYIEPYPWDPSLDEDRTAWCVVDRKDSPIQLCFRSMLQGYGVAPGYGRPWMISVVDPEDLYPPFQKPLALVVQPQDSQGPLAFRLAVTRVTDNAVFLEARAIKDGRKVVFWEGGLRFDATGKARMPFWDRTLVLMREDKAVRGTFEPRADGKGWLDAP